MAREFARAVARAALIAIAAVVFGACAPGNDGAAAPVGNSTVDQAGDQASGRGAGDGPGGAQADTDRDGDPGGGTNSNRDTGTGTPAPPPATPTPPTPTPTPAPNIVFILMDDMRADQLEFMPRTRAFFEAGGVNFTDSVVSFSECCPSRATALSGQYAHNHGVLSGDLPSGGSTRFDDTNALPIWLDDAGYQTMLVGKYLNGYGDHAPPTVPPGWDDWFALIDPSTVYWHEFDAFDNGRVVEFGADDHRTEVLGDRAVAGVKAAAAGDDPFLLWFAPVAPHIGFENADAAGLGMGVFGASTIPSALLPGAGWFPPEQAAGAYNSLIWTVPDTWGGIQRNQKPPRIANATDLPDTQIDDVADDYRRIAETLLGVDIEIGRILDALEASGELDNTLVIFTSDNGFYYGEHRLVYLKFWPYEEGIRVPLLLRGPGFSSTASGATIEAPVANVDLAPTMVRAADAAPGIEPDGIALQDISADPASHMDRAILLEVGPTFGRPVYAGVRVEGWKYIEYRDGFTELYDLARSPLEVDNLRDTAEHVERRNELALLLGALRDCAGESCRSPEPSNNAPPVAVIDPPDPVAPGELFRLHAFGSFDPDGGPLTYEWTQIGGDETQIVGFRRVTLRGLGTAGDEPLTFRLTVTDDEGDTGSADITLAALADAPSPP